MNDMVARSCCWPRDQAQLPSWEGTPPTCAPQSSLPGLQVKPSVAHAKADGCGGRETESPAWAMLTPDRGSWVPNLSQS